VSSLRYRIRAASRTVFSGWSVALALLSIALLGPFLDPIRALAAPAGETWLHMRSTVLGQYIRDTLILAISVPVLAGLFGSVSAWMVSRYDFPGRRSLEVLLVGPLAVPAYISAYAYEGIFGYFGPFYRLIRNILPGLALNRYPDISSMPGLILVMAAALYPYVFLLMKQAFRNNISNALEASRSLGDGAGRQFLRLALPMTRPVLAAGLGIVMMEVLNEYGAIVYFGRNTLTTGIFRAWFGFYDLSAARRLGGVLMISVFLFLGLEQYLRRNRGYGLSGKRQAPLERIPLRGLRGMQALILAAVPMFFGLVLPVGRLGTWALRELPDARWSGIFEGLGNTMLMSIGAALLITSLAVIIGYSRVRRPHRPLIALSDLSLMGHSVPGAVIALGILGVSSWLVSLTGRSWLAAGSIGLLMFGYATRFMAVGQRPVSAEMEHRLRVFDEAARSLGRGSIHALVNVHLPNMKRVLLAAFSLSFLEMIRELPLTMILRPFNYTTLAVRSFELASNEMLQEASLPAMLLVLIGIAGVLVFQWGEVIRND
jgi:iron(III) transport system permease protein